MARRDSNQAGAGEGSWAKAIRTQVAKTNRRIETEVFLRETQQSRAYRLPAQFAPRGRLREEPRLAYMDVVQQFYQYGTDDEEVTLQLWDTKGPNGEARLIANVGEVFSLDLEWTRRDTIRVHLIGTRPCPNDVHIYYEVFDLGDCGVAYTVPMRAFDNWRTWSQGDKIEGIPLDKRLLFIAVGDRAKLGNMDLDDFAKLNKDQVLSVMEGHSYGNLLVRPSVEDAGLDERPRSKSRSPPCITLSSNSSGDSTPPAPSSPSAGPSSGASRDGSKKSGKSSSLWQDARNRFQRYAGGSSSSTKKKLFQGTLDKEEEKSLRELLLPVFLPKLVKKEEFQTSQTLMQAQAKFEEIPVVDLQKTASSLSSELDWADLSNLSSDLDYLDVTDDDVGPASEEWSGTSGCETPSDKDSTMSAVEKYFSRDSGQGPLPAMDTMDLFLAKKVNESQIVNISTDDSVLDVSRGKTSEQDFMEL